MAAMGVFVYSFKGIVGPAASKRRETSSAEGEGGEMRKQIISEFPPHPNKRKPLEITSTELSDA